MASGYDATVMVLGYEKNTTQQLPYTNTRRFQHTLFIGKARTGKTTALTRIALDDIHAGEPVIFFGNTVLSHIPEERLPDVLYVHPKWGNPFPLNVFENVSEERYAQFADTFLATIKGIWDYDYATPTMDLYFLYGVHTLLEEGRSTLPALRKLLTDTEARSTIVGRVSDSELKDFWETFDELEPREQRAETSSTLNKLAAFVLDKTLRASIGHTTNALRLKDRIVVVDLSDMGANSAKLMGALILSQIHTEGLDGLRSHLFVDDAEPYAAGLLRIMDECPQISVQFSLSRYAPVADSAGTIVSFRTSVRDAERLEPEFGITGVQPHLYELPSHEAAVAENGTHKRLDMPEYTYPLTTGVRDAIINVR